jgi:PepSY-associated TM region
MKQAPPKPEFLRWHRRIGLMAAALVLILSLSGIALNHSTALGLDRQQITTPWLMSWYGMAPVKPATGYEAAGHRLMAAGGRIFLNGAALPHRIENVAGMVAADGALIIAGRREILVLSEGGALIERIGALPAPAVKIGLTADGRIAIATETDNVFTSDSAMLEWRPGVTAGEIRWSLPGSHSRGPLNQKVAVFEGLSLERIVLDVHSGRIMGIYGPWLMDAAALMLVLLAATGVLGWLRARNGVGGNDAV